MIARRAAMASAVAPAVLLVGGALVYPMIRLGAAAFDRDAGAGSSGLARLFRDPYHVRALAHSIALSASVAAASVGLCLLPAWTLARGRFRGRSLLRALIAAPLALSGVVIGFLAVAMIGNVGVLPEWLGIDWLRGAAYGLSGLALAYLYFEIPRATLTLEAALREVDAGLLEAARTLGAGRAQRALRVVRPLCAPALRAAFGVTFAASLGSFGVALILAARFALLPVELYRAFTGTLDDALAAAMALALALVAVAVLWATGGGRPAPSPTRGGRAALPEPGDGGRS